MFTSPKARHKLGQLMLLPHDYWVFFPSPTGPFRELLPDLSTNEEDHANIFRSMSAASGRVPADHICLWSVTRYPRAVSTAILAP